MSDNPEQTPKRVRRNNRVKLKLDEEKEVILTQWLSSGVPDPEFSGNLTVDFVEEEKPRKKSFLNISDRLSKVNYVGDCQHVEDVKYMIGVVNKSGSKMKLYDTLLFKLKPEVELRENNRKSIISSLSTKEKLDELNDKFGSKKTKKLLENKKKYSVIFQADDADNITENTNGTDIANPATPQIADSNNPSLTNSSVVVPSTPSKSFETGDVLPPQNKCAIRVDQVYSLSSIIDEWCTNLLKTNYDIDALTAANCEATIESPFVRHLFKKSSKNENAKIIAIYLDLVLKMIHLRYVELKKKDPMPDFHVEEVKEMLLDRYTKMIKSGTGTRRTVSDKSKNRLMIEGLILSLMLNDYKDLEVEKILGALKVPLTSLRKISVVVGFYFESKKNSMGINSKFFAFKLPLNQLKDFGNKKRKSR